MIGQSQMFSTFVFTVAISLPAYFLMYKLFDILSQRLWEYRVLDKQERSRWCFWSVTIAQNFVTFPLAIYYLWKRPSIWFANVDIALVVGHSIFDFWWWFSQYRWYQETPDWSLFLHHVAVIWVAGFIPILYGSRRNALFYIVVQILHEGSSPLISLTMICHLAGISKNSKIFKILSVTLLVMFVICHDVVNAFTWYHMITSGYMKRLAWGCIFILVTGIGMITLLSCFWTYAFFQRTMKLFSSKMI